LTSEWRKRAKRIDDFRWEIPRDYKPGMLVPGLIYASENMLEHIWREQAFEQVANVAFLPGIRGYSLAMPDIHWGYGFPIGGVAATGVSDGVISPGGVGFDINCGVRLLRTSLTGDEVWPMIERLVAGLFEAVPSGLGSEGRVRVSEKELDRVLIEGSRWAVNHGYGDYGDIELTEESGCMSGADPDRVSLKAKKRGIPQLGTLGSGNHFLEVQVVDKIYDRNLAQAMGISDVGQVLVMIHTGSRGFGHEVCGDYVRIMGQAAKRYGIKLPDRQLACAPVKSSEGQDYLAAMACAANYAWTNRQCIAHWVRETFRSVFDKSDRDLGMKQIYDVCHNIAKLERHEVAGKKEQLCVHRKGATRAFPAGRPEIPGIYRDVGQPVLIPGDMGRCSFVAVGTETAMRETFGSTCHGAGRVMSRSAAKRGVRGSVIARELEERGIIVKAGSMSSLAEEASAAYKDVSEVIDITDRAGISGRVARMVPMGVVKG